MKFMKQKKAASAPVRMLKGSTIKLMLAPAVLGGGIALSLQALLAVRILKNAEFGGLHSVTSHNNAFAPRNNSASAWCPNAKCSNSALCQPCKQRFLFILSTGRAASTTLLGMINHLPNVRLGGENNNALYVASLLETVLRKKDRFFNLRSKAPAVRQTGSWFHEEIPEQAMACTFQKVLHTINPPPEEMQQQFISSGSGMGGITLDDYESSQIIGAKLIRIPDGNWTAWEASEFFKYNFPCAKFIVNTRLNTDKQLASQTKIGGDWGNVPYQNDFLGKFAQNMSADTARLIYMEEWTNNVTQFNELVEWLGFQNCHFDKLLHNNKNGYQGDETPIDFGVDCRAP